MIAVLTDWKLWCVILVCAWINLLTRRAVQDAYSDGMKAGEMAFREKLKRQLAEIEETNFDPLKWL